MEKLLFTTKFSNRCNPHTIQFVYSILSNFRNLKILKLFTSFNLIHLEVVCIFFFVLYYHFIYHFFNYFYIFLKKLHSILINDFISIFRYLNIHIYFYFADIKFDPYEKILSLNAYIFSQQFI